MAAALGKGEQADRQNDKAGPVVVVLGPCDVFGIARRQFPGTGDEGLRLVGVVRCLGVKLRLQCRYRQIAMIGAAKPRPLRHHALGDLGETDALAWQIDGGRQRSQRCGREEQGDADADFSLGKAAQPQRRRRRGTRVALDHQIVHSSEQ